MNPDEVLRPLQKRSVTSGSPILFFLPIQLPLGFHYRLTDQRSESHLFDKRLLIGDGKGAGYPKGFQNQPPPPNRFCTDIVSAASVGALLIGPRLGGALKEIR